MIRLTSRIRSAAWMLAVVGLTLLDGLPAGAQTVRAELLTARTADGATLHGALHWPEGAVRGGVVSVHGYGGNFYSGVQAYLPRGLARRGFAVLALNSRDHDLGPKTSLFEANRLDLATAVEEMARRAPGPLVLHGQSMGTNRVLYYLAETGDPRIRGVILTAGPGNLFEWNVRLFGRDRAQAVLDDATKLVAEGKGREMMLVDLGPLGKALYSAEHLVSLRAPESRSDPYRNIARVTVPVLIVQGTSDPLVDHPAILPRLRQAATRAPRVDVVPVDGADHAFSRHQADLVEAIARWLGDVFPR